MERSYPLYPLGLDQIADAMDAAADAHPFPPIDLCIGSSAFDTSSYLSGLPATSKELLPYGDLAGLRGLRTAVVRMLGGAFGVDIDPARVIITDGASGALASCLASLVEPGDEVVVPSYFFPPYALLVHLAGGKCRFAAVDEAFRVTAASIRAEVTSRTRAIIVNSPSNPFGTVLPHEELEELLELGIPIVSDEVYSFLSSDRPRSLLELSSDHLVVGSMSKTYAAAGLRVGYLIAPERLKTTLLTVRATQNVCPSVPAQHMAIGLVENHDAIVRDHCAQLARNRALFIRQCEMHRLPLLTPPRHGFFGALDIRKFAPRSSLEVALDLVQTMHLATAPGSDFCQTDPSFLRINYSTDIARLESAVSRLRAYFDQNG